MNEFLELNKYELQEGAPIGKGQFGIVFKVLDKSDGKVFAAKISLSQLTEDQKPMITNLKREVNIISQLNHPSVLKFIGYSPTDFDNHPYPVIITEYASNGTLNDMITLERQSRSPPMWDDTRKLINIYGIASAMSYLHQHNIIHRDLKPANILEDDFMFPKIADFGLSKINHSNIESMSTESIDGLKGTPIYIPPESWENSTFTKAGDVYAFAIIVFEILTPDEPFKNCSIASLCNKVVYKGERPEFKYPVPECFRSLVTRCWSQNPSERPTFDDIAFELRNNESFVSECVNKDEFFDYVDMIDSLDHSFDSYKKFDKISKEKVVESSELPNKDFENFSVSKFNNLSLLMQQSVISHVIFEVSEGKIRDFFIQIKNMLAYLLQFIHEDTKKCFAITTKDENQFLNELKEEQQVNVLHTSTEKLLQSNSFETRCFIDHLNQMSDISIEFKFPSDYFEQAYVSIMKLKREAKTNIQMAVFISGVDKVDVTFRKDTNINYVTMDDTVKEIEPGFFLGGAFYACTSLKKVKISSNVTTIDSNVFYGCKSLKEVILPSSIQVIGYNAFEDCSLLEEFIIPPSVIEIGSGSFAFCSSLKKIEIPSSVLQIGIAAFESCTSLVSIKIPSSVKIIKSNAFSSCSLLKDVVFEAPSSLNEMAEEVFMKCSSLKKITIPPSVKKLGPNIFYKCISLEEISIYSSLINADEKAFPSNVKIIKLD